YPGFGIMETPVFKQVGAVAQAGVHLYFFRQMNVCVYISICLQSLKAYSGCSRTFNSVIGFTDKRSEMVLNQICTYLYLEPRRREIFEMKLPTHIFHTGAGTPEKITLICRIIFLHAVFKGTVIE